MLKGTTFCPLAMIADIIRNAIEICLLFNALYQGNCRPVTKGRINCYAYAARGRTFVPKCAEVASLGRSASRSRNTLLRGNDRSPEDCSIRDVGWMLL